MEDNKTSTGKVALKYGIIFGLITVVFTFMLYTQDLHYQLDLQRIIITVIISLVFIAVAAVLGMLEFKKANNGFMSIGQGLKIGVGAALISGIIAGLFNILLTQVIDPDTQQKALEYSAEMMRDAGMTAAQIDQQLEGAKNQSPFTGLVVGLISSIIFGFLGSIIPALVIKKSEPEY